MKIILLKIHNKLCNYYRLIQVNIKGDFTYIKKDIY